MAFDLSGPEINSMEDRITVLPDSVLRHILSFLPTKHAATTTILSKRWKSVWLSVETLDFEDQTFNVLTCYGFRYSVYLAMFARNITIPIVSFRLKLESDLKSLGMDSFDVNRFIYFAMERGIERLNINIYIELPLSILSCKTLKVLKLKRIIVNNLSVDVDFPLLKTLYMKTVSFQRHEYLAKLLSGCPVLEELQTKGLSVVVWDSLIPKEKLNANLLPNLIKAKIFDDYIIPMRLVSKVQSLHVELTTWTCSPKLPNLTQLEIKFSSVYWPDMWNWLLQMLEHCPKLQSLTIQDCIDRNKFSYNSWKDPPIVPKCLSSELRTCCLIGYKSIEVGFQQFAKYIIQNSKALRTVTINCSTGRWDWSPEIVDTCDNKRVFIKRNRNRYYWLDRYNKSKPPTVKEFIFINKGL